jgi:hypothetical protein
MCFSNTLVVFTTEFAINAFKVVQAIIAFTYVIAVALCCLQALFTNGFPAALSGTFGLVVVKTAILHVYFAHSFFAAAALKPAVIADCRTAALRVAVSRGFFTALALTNLSSHVSERSFRVSCQLGGQS